MAAQAHARGMGVAMKNNNEDAAFHVDDYDMVVNEECWFNGNCNNYVRIVLECYRDCLTRLVGDTSRL